MNSTLLTSSPVENNTNVDRAELHNAEVEPIAKKYLELRYRLLPFNYTLAREAADTGLPMMRALWLRYPGDSEAVKLGSEYLWGRDLLVAPVVEKGAKSRRVYLPARTWFDWWTGEKLAVPRWVDRPVDLATLPLYVRAGAIVPLDPVRQFTGQSVTEPTTLRVHPGADGAFTLYDDDGQGQGYRDGSDAKTVWIRLRWDNAVRRLSIEPEARMKKWPGGCASLRSKSWAATRSPDGLNSASTRSTATPSPRGSAPARRNSRRPSNTPNSKKPDDLRRWMKLRPSVSITAQPC